MRATPGAAIIADAVWDENLSVTHQGAGTAGWYNKHAYDDVNAVKASFLRRTPYAYSDTLAAGAYFVPPATTIVTEAHQSTAAEMEVYSGVKLLGPPAAGLFGFALGAFYCDGTLQKFKNGAGAGRTITITGITP